MNAQLTTLEITSYRERLQDYEPGKEALATLEKHNGRLDESFYELWTKKNGLPQEMTDPKSVWTATVEQLRKEVCEDDRFRTKVQEYNKNPGSAPLLRQLIVYLVGLVGTGKIPLDPAIATVIILYILKIELDIFCEDTQSPAVDPSSRRIPYD